MVGDGKGIGFGKETERSRSSSIGLLLLINERIKVDFLFELYFIVFSHQ